MKNSIGKNFDPNTQSGSNIFIYSENVHSSRSKKSPIYILAGTILQLRWIVLLVSIFFAVVYVGLILSLPPIYLLAKAYPLFWGKIGFYIHAYPGSIWLVFGALQFFSSIRAKNPKVHRILGRIALICLFISTIGGYIICLSGETEGGNVLVFTGSLIFPSWLLCVSTQNDSKTSKYSSQGVMGWYYIKYDRNITLHREWMCRAYSWSYSIVLMRPGVGLVISYYKVAYEKNITNGEALAIVAPVFFLTTMLLTEIYIRSTRTKSTIYPQKRM